MSTLFPGKKGLIEALRTMQQGAPVQEEAMFGKSTEVRSEPHRFNEVCTGRRKFVQALGAVLGIGVLGGLAVVKKKLDDRDAKLNSPLFVELSDQAEKLRKDIQGKVEDFHADVDRMENEQATILSEGSSEEADKLADEAFQLGEQIRTFMALFIHLSSREPFVSLINRDEYNFVGRELPKDNNVSIEVPAGVSEEAWREACSTSDLATDTMMARSGLLLKGDTLVLCHGLNVHRRREWGEGAIVTLRALSKEVEGVMIGMKNMQRATTVVQVPEASENSH